MDEELKKALKKRAAGFYSRDVTEEFSATEDGEARLTKRKVNKKYIPPDVSALKELLSLESGGVETLSDEELLAERERLMKELKSAGK